MQPLTPKAIVDFRRRDTLRLDDAASIGGRQLSPVTRAGIFVYHNDDGSIRRELRAPEWVFHADSLASLAQVPLTLGHPDDFVDDDNFATLAVGYTGDTVRRDGDLVLTPIKLARRDAKMAVAGGVRELSCGYEFTGLDETPGEYNGEAYDAVQVGPYSYNHVALVAQGRAGPSVRYLDGVLSAEHLAAALAAGEPMETQTIRIDDAEATIPTDLAALLLKLHAKMEAMEGELAEAKAQNAAAAELAGEDDKAKNDDCNDGKKANDAADDVQARVDARVALQASLLPHLPADYAFAGKSDAQVRADALHALCPDLSVEGRSDDYISARLDAAIDARRMDGYRGLAAPIAGAASTVDKAHDEYLASLKAREARTRGIAA